MARNKGTLNISTNLEPIIRAPLDARMKVRYYGDLVDPSSWIDSDGNTWLYKGAIVSVAEDPSSGIYFLKDSDNYDQYTNWIPAGDNTSIDGSINLVNLGSGDVQIYAGLVGADAAIRELKAGPGVTLTYSDSSAIIISVDASFAGSEEFYNADPVVESVGGISAGSTFFDSSKGFAETMQAIFYPVQYPSLTAPSLSFSDNIASLVEIGNIVSISYDTTFSRGSINPQYTSASPYRSGDPNTYNYDLIGDARTISSTSVNDSQILSGYEVVQGVQTSTVYVDYDAGVQPKDSEGGDYDSPLPSGNTSTSTLTFEGVYPLFGKTSSISSPNTKQPLVSMISGNLIVFALVAESGGFKQTFDIPDAWTASRPLTGVETYNTVSTTWEYQGGSASASLTYWTTSSVTQTIEGNVVNYTRYSYNGPDRSSIQIRLRF